MSAPRTPDEFKALISSPTSTLCGNFINTLLKLPTYVYEIINYMFDELGNVTNAFKQQITPPGAIVAFAGASAPDDWLLCQGQEVLRADFPELFSAIGIIYGAGNGTTTFNVPDLRGRFPAGAGTTTILPGDADEHPFTLALADSDGEDVVELAPDEYGRDHIHITGRGVNNTNDNTYFVHTDNDMQSNEDGLRIVGGSAGAPTEAALADQTGKYRVTSEAVDSTGEDPEIDPHNNLPPYLVLNWIIKT